MPGYSGTPLAKKLGIKDASKILVVNSPRDYVGFFDALPASVCLTSKLDASVDIVHLFTTTRDELAAALASYRGQLDTQAMVWISWPKKSSKMVSEVSEDTVRELALPLGFVDVKVCAVDEVWSGLKLVLRKELR